VSLRFPTVDRRCVPTVDRRSRLTVVTFRVPTVDRPLRIYPVRTPDSYTGQLRSSSAALAGEARNLRSWRRADGAFAPSPEASKEEGLR
jgi:hypothetical protein